MSDSPQFIITDDTKNDNTKMISINLCPGVMPLHKNTNEYLEDGEIIIGGYTKTPLNGGYIQIPYICPGGTTKPNATYVDNLSVKSYKTTNLYIFKQSHLIADISYDAELVIELIPTTNTGDKLYLCFLLNCYRDKKTPANDIDNVITKSNNTVKNYKGDSCNIQPLIDKNQKKIVYKNGINTIVVFTKKINIKEHDFSNYSTIPADLFTLLPSTTDDYKVIIPTNEGGQEGFHEGFQEGVQKRLNAGNTNVRGKKAIMTCTPINTNDPSEIDNSLIYTNTEKGVTMASHVIFVGIFIVIFIAVVAIFMFPSIYFMMMNNSFIDNNERIIYTGVFLILSFILAFVLFLNGKKHDPQKQPLAGFIIISFVVLSVCGVRMNVDSLNKIGFNLSAFVLDTALSRIIAKWTASYKYISVTFFGLLCILGFVVHFSVKKRKFKTLKKKSSSYVKNLSDLILGFGITYGFVVITMIAFMTTPAPVE